MTFYVIETVDGEPVACTRWLSDATEIRDKLTFEYHDETRHPGEVIVKHLLRIRVATA